jgi:hypothetical protein
VPGPVEGSRLEETVQLLIRIVGKTNERLAVLEKKVQFLEREMETVSAR